MLDRSPRPMTSRWRPPCNALTSLLEPILILVMVGIVMIIIIAVLMPLMELTNTLS